jgi:site-specific recombinase XerD
MKTPASQPIEASRGNDPPKLSREILTDEIKPLTPLATEFLQNITHQASATQIIYARTLRQLTQWIEQKPGGAEGFKPELLTSSALTLFLEELAAQGYSLSHRARIKAVASRFARWLMEEKSLLSRNPARAVVLPTQQLLAPRELSSDQRYVLRSLAERNGNARTLALFSLGYWAGCRISDVAHLKVQDTHIGPKVGWMTVGFKGGKQRDIDLVNEVRKPLFEYMTQQRRETLSPYMFLSQRHERLTESGLHQWFRTLKKQARKEEWELIEDITFHDLRHDFAHRARASGWNLEEIAYYLGHVTARGLPAIQTTARYTQVSREHVKNKLRLLRG